MTRLEDIPVYTEGMDIKDDEHMLDAVIYELKQLMDTYIASGKTGAIDIRSLPISEIAHKKFQDKLGFGEVEARARLSGNTDVYETALSGVWWVTHKNNDGKIIAENIEVGGIPAVLCAHIEDMKVARKKVDEKMM